MFVLLLQLGVEKKEDKHKYDAAWNGLEQADPAATALVMDMAQALADSHKLTPLQGTHLEDVTALMAEAAEVEDAFHAATKKLILEAGGEFKQGPLKKQARVVEKIENGRCDGRGVQRAGT